MTNRSPQTTVPQPGRRPEWCCYGRPTYRWTVFGGCGTSGCQKVRFRYSLAWEAAGSPPSFTTGPRRLTCGQLEGDYFGTSSNVVIATVEDAMAQVAVPRLVAAGADLERISFAEYHTEGIAGIVNLPGDLDALAAACEKADARLLVLDPVVAFLDGKVDAHRDQDVRRVLVGLVRLAERCDAAVSGVIHLNKAATTDVISRVSGSIGFVNAARSVLFAGPDPTDETRSVLIPVKNNLAALGDGIAYRIEPRSVTARNQEIQTQGIAWLGLVPGLTASEMLADLGRHDRGALDEAADFLEAELALGPVPAKQLIQAARKAGISERTLTRTKKALGVSSKKIGKPGDTVQSWCWVRSDYSEDGHDDPKVVRPRDRPSSGDAGHLRHEGTLPVVDRAAGCSEIESDEDLGLGLCVECNARPATRTSGAGRPWCTPCWNEALAVNPAVKGNERLNP